MITVVIVLLLVSIGMPLAYAFRLWRLDEPSRAEWLIVTLEAIALVALVLLVGRWDIAGYYTRFALAISFIGALFWSYRKHASRPWRPFIARPFWRHNWSRLASLTVLCSAWILVLIGLRANIEPQPLAFPLQHERAFVGQGGGIALLNHHANHPEQRFAIDLTAINAAGFRATGLLPERLSQYEVWDVAVTSPCDGVVLGRESGLPDLIPPATDPKHAAGNHVVLDCGDFRVKMAHFKKGTVILGTGQFVATGEALGRVGNSGNTTEPHLMFMHMRKIPASDVRSRSTAACRSETASSKMRQDCSDCFRRGKRSTLLRRMSSMAAHAAQLPGRLTATQVMAPIFATLR